MLASATTAVAELAGRHCNLDTNTTHISQQTAAAPRRNRRPRGLCQVAQPTRPSVNRPVLVLVPANSLTCQTIDA